MSLRQPAVSFSDSPLAVLIIVILCALANLAYAEDVLTYHNINARTGLNDSETVLTPENVNSATFGKLFTIPADGLVDAQPLYVSAVSISGVADNLLIVATEHDSIYAYDADSGALIWHKTALKSGEVPSDNRGCSQVTPDIGITSTPVIYRPATGNPVIYLVAMSKNSSGDYYHGSMPSMPRTAANSTAAPSISPPNTTAPATTAPAAM